MIIANVLANVLIIICEDEEQAKSLHKEFDEYVSSRFNMKKGFFSNLTMVEGEKKSAYANTGKKSYRCTECGNLFYEEDPPATIPVSVVWCPRCDNLAERHDLAEYMTDSSKEEKKCRS